MHINSRYKTYDRYSLKSLITLSDFNVNESHLGDVFIFGNLDESVRGYIQIGETQHEIYSAPNKTKVPDILFYDNHQVSISKTSLLHLLMEATNNIFDRLALSKDVSLSLVW